MKKLLLALLVVAAGAVVTDVAAARPRSANSTCSTCNKPAKSCGCAKSACAKSSCGKAQVVRTFESQEKPECCVQVCKKRMVEENYTEAESKQPIEYIHTVRTYGCPKDCQIGNAAEMNQKNGVKPAKTNKMKSE